jgi:hypothetical protein
MPVAHGVPSRIGAEHRPVACMLVRMNGFTGDERRIRSTATCPPLNARQPGLDAEGGSLPISALRYCSAVRLRDVESVLRC